MDLHERHHDAVLVLDIRGPIGRGLEASQALRARVRSLLERGHRFVLLNVGDLTYVDSVWLGAIVQGYASALRHGGALKLVNVSPRFRELLKISRLDTVIELHDSEDAAVASFQRNT